MLNISPKEFLSSIKILPSTEGAKILSLKETPRNAGVPLSSNRRSNVTSLSIFLRTAFSIVI